MGNFTEESGPPGPVKALFLGDTGSGKTGALCALAAYGYRLHVLDLDNNIGVMRDYLTNKSSPYVLASPGLWPAGAPASRVDFETITDSVKIINNVAMAQGDAWPKIAEQFNNWKPLGNITKFGLGDVLVVDSLSRLARYAFNFQLKLGGRLGKRPEQSDWFLAQDLVERILLLLASPELQCHVIIICHVAYIEREGDAMQRGFPQTIGAALSPKVGQNFGHMLLAKTQGAGGAAKRRIITSTTGIIDLKTPAPLRVKPEYDLGTGLAEYWKDLGQVPGQVHGVAPGAK